MAAPAELEGSRIHVVHGHALLFHNVHLVGILVEIEKFDGHDDVVGVLIIHGDGAGVLARRFFGMAVAKVPQELSIASKFLNAVVTGVSATPNIALPIHDNEVLGARARAGKTLGRPSEDLL